MNPVAVGDVLASKYRVDRILGIGGMGMVVAATQLDLDRKVALKFMLDPLASQHASERFLREARAAVRLRGEHVCRVLDVGKLETGSPYIVMELMDGQDFAAVLANRGILPVAEAVDHVLQALEGIAEAHANAIIHRDLKPGNLFVTVDNDGTPLVKVLDFGISKLALGGGVTKTGDMMGSPAYMAPEQMLSAKDADARADLWAVGVILYQAVSGRLPYEHESLAALCLAILNDVPRHLREVSSVPAPFANIVMRCLSKQRDERFADAAELAAALVPFGSADAGASSARIQRVLQRAGSNAAVPPLAQTPAIGVASTMGASAGESIARPNVVPRRAKRIVAIGAVLAAIVTIVVVVTRPGAEPSINVTPIARPPSTITRTPEPRPVTPPVAPKSVEIVPEPAIPPKPVPKPAPKRVPKPIVVPPANGSASAGSGSGSGSGTGSGSGYKGTKGQIDTRYPG